MLYRPIEDFLRLLSTRVYRGNDQTDDLEQLRARIRRSVCMEIDVTVQSLNYLTEETFCVLTELQFRGLAIDIYLIKII